MKLLIADRDHHERIVIEWLISAYSLPIKHVHTASTLKETLSILENEVPDILYIELDMIPNENWALATRYIKYFCQKIIAVTAEATFERAKQAIDWQSVDLLVKPLEPSIIKQSLHTALLSFSSKSEKVHISQSILEENISYRTLFLLEEQTTEDIALMLLQTENHQKIAELVPFLTYYPFPERPHIFPLTNMVVCLFRKPTKDIKEAALKILRDWEITSFEPLAAVVIPRAIEKTTMYEMYQTAKRLLEVTFFIGYHQVILPKTTYECWREIDPFLTSSEQREWIDMLNSFDKQKIKQWMHNEFLHIETPFPNPEMLRTRLTSILAQIRRYMKTYQLNQPDMEDYYMRIFAEILYNRVLYRIVQEMLLFLYELLERAEQAEAFSKKDVIEIGISFIEERFADPELNLEKVAEAVGRSASYYSHLLMKKQGVSFRQLLNDLRIKEARNLLTKTQLSVKEISHLVGYQNSNYFTRIFKETTKRTPRDYRLYRWNEMK